MYYTKAPLSRSNRNPTTNPMMWLRSVNDNAKLSSYRVYSNRGTGSISRVCLQLLPDIYILLSWRREYKVRKVLFDLGQGIHWTNNSVSIYTNIFLVLTTHLHTSALEESLSLAALFSLVPSSSLWCVRLSVLFITALNSFSNEIPFLAALAGNGEWPGRRPEIGLIYATKTLVSCFESSLCSYTHF